MQQENHGQGGLKEGIVTVGSGTAEYVLNCSSEKIALGKKYTAGLTLLYGGSGVNYAMRLLSAGYQALPILAIGQDELGRKIQKALLSEAKKTGGQALSERFINPANKRSFFDPQIKTSSTVIIVNAAQRTIFTQRLQKGEYFIKHVRRRVQDVVEILGAYPAAVMIGHIHSDAIVPGECTKYLIESFAGRSFIFANFGNSQIDLGLDFWRPYLPDIDLFQLNLEEAKRFFSEAGKKTNLVQVIDKVRSIGINAVITLDKFGAVGIHKEKKESIVLAWPLIGVEDIVDSTGAGDAFGAGLVSGISNAAGLDFEVFLNAIEVARAWSALACQSLGGCSNCPDRKAIEAYRRQIAAGENRAVEIKDQNYASEILSLIDIAFTE